MAETRFQLNRQRTGFDGWRRAHQQAAREALVSMWRRPFASAMTMAVIAIALTLPLTLWLVFANAAAASGKLRHNAHLSVFLLPDMPVQRVRKISTELQVRSEVVGLTVVTPDEALAEYEAMTGGDGKLDALDGINPFPHVLLLEIDRRVRDGERIERLLSELREHPGIDRVVFDLAWLERLQAIVRVGVYLALALGVLLSVGVALTVGNTIRLEIERQREEIEVLQLFGGTRAFVRRPFLWSGVVYGLVGGAVASALTALELLLVSGPVAALAASYGSDFVLIRPGPLAFSSMLLLSGLLGVFGAWLAVGRFFLDLREPGRIAR